ncbi:cob(I)yrinic acid a,c-diamide adenosyltransferase [Patescibacteria group bacterium]|nr:cob(I)yrinic acid a,c-diamide adenosyltransferase [Patescibacteria group bacterium]
MPIYTRTGDSGETSLFGGKRVLKCHELVDAYGSLDELNSWVGLVISGPLTGEQKQFFTTVQSDLFLLGSGLAGWPADLSPLATRIPRIEGEIDAMEAKLPALANFILPGGSPYAAYAHITRSICRRVERQVVALRGKQEVDPGIVPYLNRLSDLFFVLARSINSDAHIGETVWTGIPRNINNRHVKNKRNSV